MSKKTSYDDLETDYFDEEAGSSFLSLISLAVAFLAVAAFIALAWYAYQDDGSEDGGVETIYADSGEFRSAPESDGGWQFPDADREVYNLGNDEEIEENAQVEQILPKPERPEVRESVGAEGWIVKPKDNEAVAITDAERRKMEEIAAAALEKADAVKASKTQEAAEEAAKQVEKVVEPIVDVAKPVIEKPAAVVKKVEKKEVKKKSSSESSSNNAKLTSNRLQLGAFGSNSEALRSWSKIQGKHRSLLSSKNAHVEVADVNGKTYYRVQVYPFDSRSAADALCVILKSRNQACFSVKK